MYLVQGDLFIPWKPKRTKPIFIFHAPKDAKAYYTCSECDVRLNQQQLFSSHMDKDNYHKDPEQCPTCAGEPGFFCGVCYGGGWV